MNLLAFIFMVTIPYQGTNGTLLLGNGMPTIGGLGEYTPSSKELMVEYSAIFEIGTAYFDFGIVEETTTTRDRAFESLYFAISDIVIVAPTTEVAIYQAKHTYFYIYSDNSLNYSTVTQVSKQITNPIKGTFTITSDNTLESPLLIYSNESYNSGYHDGYDVGYDRGHDVGYEAGEAAGNGVNNVISWFGNVWDALTNFLGLEIAPNLKIGTLITIPVVVGVLLFALKALIQ